MSIEAGLHADIIDHPDDDTLRLIYADWLEDERQGERADFVRLDLAKEKGELPSEDRERRRNLYKQHHMAWSVAIDRLVRRRVYRRGLVESVYLTGEQFLRGVSELNRLAPIREVALCEQVDLGRIAGALSQSRASRLDLSKCMLVGEGLRSLLGRPALTNLQSLVLGDWIDKAALSQLLNSYTLGSVSKLSLSISYSDGRDQGLAPFFVGPLGGVRDLKLRTDYQGEECLLLLARSVHAEQLRVLELRSYFRTNNTTALAESPHLARLDRLDLRGSPLGDEARKRLIARFGERVLFD